MTNRFKELDLIDRVPEELRTEVPDIVKEAVIMTIPKKKKCKKEKKNLRDTATSNTREDSTHGHHQMVNTEIRLIIFFAAKDGEALYSQQKQVQEQTVAQIKSLLLPNSDLN